MYNGKKDANEALQADREAFRRAVELERERAEQAEENEKQEEREAYLKTSAGAYIQSFLDGIAESVNTPAQSTGFPKLDNALDGGLYEGLHIVGAMPSLGKTTLVLQIADHVALTGHDVLIFSLEMSRYELMSKSISRETYLDVLANNGDRRNAKTARGITAGSRYQNYSQEEHELIQRAVSAYGSYAQHLFISEGMGDIGTDEVRKAVDRHQRITGKAPVVIIDYLQILTPHDARATDKQNADRAVKELANISKKYKIPIIAISSLNRAGYREEVSLEALKESGGVEYGADVVLGLQFKGTKDSTFDSTGAKRKDPREIELVVLKQRLAPTGEKIDMEFYAPFNLFLET
jgi:replicative DNA helicase